MSTKPAVTPSVTGKKNPLDPPKVEDIDVKKCEVQEHTDGGLLVTFYVDPTVAKRLNLKRGGMPLDRYLYENVLYRAVVSHVY